MHNLVWLFSMYFDATNHQDFIMNAIINLFKSLAHGISQFQDSLNFHFKNQIKFLSLVVVEKG